MIKNIIFDWGNVLHIFNRKLLLSSFTDKADEMLPYVFLDWEKADFGEYTYDEYVNNAKANMPKEYYPAADEFYAGWMRVSPSVEGMPGLIEKLYNKGISIYLLSNASDFLYENVDMYPEMKFFKGKVVSGPIKMRKPDAEIFEYALGKFGIFADETIFVDDTAENVVGAENVGIHGVLFKSANELEKELKEKYNIF